MVNPLNGYLCGGLPRVRIGQGTAPPSSRSLIVPSPPNRNPGGPGAEPPAQAWGKAIEPRSHPEKARISTKSKLGFIVLVIFFLSLMQPVWAGEIVFSTENPKSFSSQDEEIVVRLDVKNTLGEDILGSFTWTVCEQGGSGNTQSFTDTRVLFNDQDSTEFRIRPGEGEHYLVDVTFDYFDDDDPETVYHVALEGIDLRLKGSPACCDTDPPREILESVQTKITKGSAQKPSGALQGERGGHEDQKLLSRIQSGPDNTGSLSQLLEKESIDLSEKKARLKECVVTSDLYTTVDEFLEGAGFTPHDLGVTLGQERYHDEFGIGFTNENNTEVQVSGEIKDGDLLFINVKSPGMTPPFYGIEGNETYRSLDAMLRNEDYAVSTSLINITPEEAEMDIIYEKGDLKKFITINFLNGEPVSVVLEEPDSGIHFIFPVLVLVITALSALLCYRLYLKWYRKNEDDTDDGFIIDAEKSTETPLELLEKSHARYLNGEFKEAFSTAGQALRLHISLNYNRGDSNTTNLGALTLLRSAHDPEYDRYAEVLSVCDMIVYGGREPDEALFPRNYEEIRSILDKDQIPEEDGDR